MTLLLTSLDDETLLIFSNIDVVFLCIYFEGVEFLSVSFLLVFFL